MTEINTTKMPEKKHWLNFGKLYEEKKIYNYERVLLMSAIKIKNKGILKKSYDSLNIFV